MGKLVAKPWHCLAWGLLFLTASSFNARSFLRRDDASSFIRDLELARRPLCRSLAGSWGDEEPPPLPKLYDNNLTIGLFGKKKRLKKLNAPLAFNPIPFGYREELVLNISHVADNSCGVARVLLNETQHAGVRTSAVDNATYKPGSASAARQLRRALDSRGWVVFVFGALPGETVRCRVNRNCAAHSEAYVVEVLKKSHERQEPRCPLFGICGGCQYQHMSRPLQHEIKALHLHRTLRAAGMQDVSVNEFIYEPGDGYHYRRKLSLSYLRPVAGVLERLGFYARIPGRKLLNVTQCPLASEQLNAHLPKVWEELASRLVAQFEANPRVAIKKQLAGSVLVRHSDSGVTTNGREWVLQDVNGTTIYFEAGEFFQNNAQLLPRLVGHVVDAIRAPLPLGPEDTGLWKAATAVQAVLDCYCGSGLFALCAAPFVPQVIGVETSRRAIQCASLNAQHNIRENCEFINADAEQFLQDAIRLPVAVPWADSAAPRSPHRLPTAESTAVILDPPRTGCSPGFIEAILRYGPARIVYVSCNPETMARDCAVLRQGTVDSHYAMEAVTPFDMFPHTVHTEVVAVLNRVNAAPRGNRVSMRGTAAH
eukprot:GHVU01104466.1.p1 GENE.GHVU01104466.1~~GHVU01104466.1.p1  ORF type:complete len:596 (-),score=53.89 GHVU01104466.1:192-1979(-)